MEKKDITAGHLAAAKSIVDLAWSKDDNTIFFVSNLGDYLQIWAEPSRGGFPRQMTFLERDVRVLELSPDGSKIAFMADAGGDEDYKLYVIPAEGGTPRCLTNNYKLRFPTLAWSPDSSKLAILPEKDGAYNVAVVEAESCAMEFLTDTEDLKMYLDWSRDGKWISFTNYKGKLRSDICLVNTENRDIVNLTAGFGGENYGGHFSPDSANIAFTSDAKGNKNVAIMNIEKRTSLWMPEKNCERIFCRWNHQGNRFTYIENAEAELAVYEWDYPPRMAKRISPQGYLASICRYSHKDDKIALIMSAPNRTGEVFISDYKTLRKITDLMIFGLEPAHFVKPEKIRYKSFDDLEIPALYYKPADVEKYPVILWIHGGPTHQHFNGWNPFIQLFVLNGIGVLAPNLRGSTGYGKEFENQVFHDWGGGDLQDVAYAVEYLKRDPKVDTEKIIVGGASYGGYMTMMAVTRKPDLWAAGINIMGIANLETFYNSSTAWMKPILETKYGFKAPEEDPDYFRERSPINFVDSIKCPLLLLYGRNDIRVEINQMEELEEKLKFEGKVFEEQVFEEEGHTMNRMDTRLSHYSRIMKFIDKYVLHPEKTLELPEVPEMPDMPGSMEMPETGGEMDLSAMPEMPDLDAIPETPGMDDLGALPEIPDLDEMPEIPSIEESEGEQDENYQLDGMTGQTEFPDMPDMPELGEETSEVMLEEAGLEAEEYSGYQEQPQEEEEDFDIPDIPELPVFE